LEVIEEGCGSGKERVKRGLEIPAGNGLPVVTGERAVLVKPDGTEGIESFTL
jgi:hypothetical protein